MPANSPSSRRSRITGGIPRARCSARCTSSIRCASAWIETAVGGLAGKRVVDVGCGGGILSEAMAGRGARGPRHRPRRQAAGRRPAAQARVRAPRSTTGWSPPRRSLPRRPGGFDVVTCMEMLEHVPDPASTIARLRDAGAARRQRRRLDDQPQPEVVPARDRRRRVRARSAAQGHARLREVRPPCGGVGLGAARRASSPTKLDGIGYNPFTRTFRLEPGHRGQLPRRAAPPARGLTRRRGAALPVDAVLFDLDGTLADTAPDLAAALNRVRGDRGLPPLPYRALRPHASHGARGLIGAGFGIGPGDDDFPALRDAFLAHYAAALCVESALFADVAALLDAIEARGLAWGIVTNKAARFTQPLLDLLPPLHARRHRGLRRHDARTPSRTRRRCCTRRAELGIAAGALPVRRRRPARHRGRRSPPGMPSIVARLRLHRAARGARRAGRRWASSTARARCSTGCRAADALIASAALALSAPRRRWR